MRTPDDIRLSWGDSHGDPITAIIYEPPRRERFDLTPQKLFVGVRFTASKVTFGQTRPEIPPAIVDTGTFLSVFPPNVWKEIPDKMGLVFEEGLPKELQSYERQIWGMGAYKDAGGQCVGTIPCEFGFVELKLFDGQGASGPIVLPVAYARRNTIEPVDLIPEGKSGRILPFMLGVAGLLNVFRISLNSGKDKHSTIHTAPNTDTENLSLSDWRRQYADFPLQTIGSWRRRMNI